MGKTIILIVASAALLASGAHALAQGLQARSGEEVFVQGLYRWNALTCESMKVHFDIVEQPKHGKLRIAKGQHDPYDAEAVIGGDNNCAGTPIASTDIYYRSSAGYKGADRFRMKVITPEGSRVLTFKVDVK